MKFAHFTYAALATALIASPAAAQDTWTWKKALAAGRLIEIKGINGDISATAANGREIEVIAKKSARKSNTETVKLVAVEHADGVTICAVYPDAKRGEPNECRPGSKGRMNNNNNDVTVDFEVRVPQGIEFVGRTVNGSINASGLTADAEATTVNGSVRLVTTGIAEAHTVNGGINVKMGRSTWTDALAFGTVNGSITLSMPDPLSTEVTASTVNGSISTDWPLTMTGRWGPKRMHGKIGSGGRDLELSTVNGDIELRKN